MSCLKYMFCFDKGFRKAPSFESTPLRRGREGCRLMKKVNSSDTVLEKMELQKIRPTLYYQKRLVKKSLSLSLVDLVCPKSMFSSSKLVNIIITIRM